MEEYYIKRGKKYVPLGYNNISKDIPFGIWYVRKTDGGSSYTNMISFADAEIMDIKKVTSQIDLRDKICDVLIEMNKEGLIGLAYIPYADVAKRIAQEIYK